MFSLEYTVGFRKFIKVQAKKNSCNQLNFLFDQIPIFCNFKNGQKSIFELGKSLKLSKIQFHENNLWFICFHEFFCLDFFKFSGLLWSGSMVFFEMSSSLSRPLWSRSVRKSSTKHWFLAVLGKQAMLWLP